MDIQISLSADRTKNGEQFLELYLFRHGYTRYNLEHRYQGISDIPLLETERERIQPARLQSDGSLRISYSARQGSRYTSADALSDGYGQEFTESEELSKKHDPVLIKTEDLVYVSPALRARQTAELLFPCSRQSVVPEFAEMNFGIFEGRRADDMKEDPQYRSWVDSMCEAPVPLGESKAEYTKRVTERFQKIVCDVLERGNRRLVIVAHGGTQMVVMERFCEERRPYWTWKSNPGEWIYGWILCGAAHK